MLDIAAELHHWCEQERDFAVATVVAVSGSAPRQPGAALAVDGAGEAVGSVSGGCVEGAVYELCREAMESGRSVVQRFGYSDEDAFAVGLTCGGVIDILVTPVRAGTGAYAMYAEAVAAAADGRAVALTRVVEGPEQLMGGAMYVPAAGEVSGTLGGSAALDETAAAESRALLDAGRTATVETGTEGGAPGAGGRAGAGEGDPMCGPSVTLLVESSAPPPRMLVFGAIDFASALARTGAFLGYRVTVCDARPVFATAARFPDADEVVVEWPHRYLDSQELDGRTVVCVLTHDVKFDVPLLERALRLPIAYVGAMGSRRTHLARLEQLREEGVGEDELARLHSPIGLDLGARTPEETALSIAAEIVAVRHGGTGTPLTGAHIPIHR
ncbi:XshC-Cox1-family protein [Streptomyces abyssalis]|uniref:XshC-Cox1-family protein n=1 Tax=Streptomyces abyssalis TaxID=933944 RepID=A0A1E7JRV2_9ACTN|nr:XdhC/CoxI family protein [Streptomyces abyssalis]OEU91609.1 XshC-Cox1-family protein [Streptomyces abyssalis]OEU94255.1 XshC-Cox1-family protein [Streptomyces abyssalis]OEV04722.1 XshC-Cox1-family protein [Streptomyces nanshensis]